MMLATPRDLDPTVKLVLWAVFAFAHDDGTGIYVGTEALMECTGLPRRTLFRCLKTLTDRGYLTDDGWKVHGPGLKTRMRSIDLVALQRDRGNNVAAGTAENWVDVDPDDAGNSATHGTSDHSATHGTVTGATVPPMAPSTVPPMAPKPREGNQEKRDSSLREGAAAPNEAAVIPSVLPAVVAASAEVEPAPPQAPSIWQALFRDGVPILRALIGKSDTASRTMLGALLKAADDDAARVYGLIREAEDLCPADPQAWLYAAAKRGRRSSGAPRRENTGARLRRELGLDADLDSLFADPAATGVTLQ
jgi:hypothetical protein